MTTWTDTGTLKFQYSTSPMYQRKALAIVGSNPRTREYAPWGDRSIDIWVFNEAAAIPWCKRVSGVLQLHSPEIYRSEHNLTYKEHWEWLQRPHGYPIYMQDVDPLVPDSVRYPLEEITARYLRNFQWYDKSVIEFYTNTPAYAIALGVYLGYDEIQMFGMDMDSNTEYQYQRDNVAFWTGIALGAGVKIIQHCGQSLFDAPRYGYDGQIYYTFDELEGEREYLLAEAKKSVEAHQVALMADDELDIDYVENHSKLIDATIAKGAALGMLEELDRYLGRDRFGVHRQEFEMMAAGNKQSWDRYTAMMNYESGRCQAYWDIQDMTSYETATRKQLDLAFSSGVEMGKYQFNYRHMAVMDLKIRAAGGSKAAAMLNT